MAGCLVAGGPRRGLSPPFLRLERLTYSKKKQHKLAKENGLIIYIDLPLDGAGCSTVVEPLFGLRGHL